MLMSDEAESRGSHRRQRYVSVSEEIALAVEGGVEAVVCCGVKREALAIRVGLTTTDRDPTLAIKVDGGVQEALLDEREQSGPDRWDYGVNAPIATEYFFLRLRGARGSADVPFIPAAFAIMATFGWTDDISLIAEPRVERDVLARNLRSLAPSAFSQTDDE
jgi:hypothetical protein